MTEMTILEMKPDLAGDIKRIHASITRGVFVGIDRTAAMMNHTFQTEHLRGFLDYLRSLTSLVYAHNRSEDEIAFPMFRGRSLEAPYEMLVREHVTIGKTLNGLNLAILLMERDPLDPTAMTGAHAQLQQLNEQWKQHIRTEEYWFTGPRINACFTGEEQQQLGMQLAQHALKNSSPEYLVIPFYLFNLSEQERVIAQQLLPPIITKHLLPFIWKNKWMHMRPFFLG